MNSNKVLCSELRLKFLFYSLPFLIGLCVDLYVPSLPVITEYYNIKINLVQLTISFYLLGYSAGQLILGILSDYYGRKKLLIICGFIYTLVSFAAAFSPNIYFLILCRMFQGIAVAGLASVIRAVVTDCFNGLALTRMMNCIALGWGLGPIVGPFIGSCLQNCFSWEADFIFLGLYSLFITIYIIFLLPETNQNRKSIELVSCIELISNIKSIITHPVFICCTILLSLIYGVLILFNLTGPFLIQVIMKYSVLDYGYIALLLGFGNFTGCYMNKYLISYLEPKKISVLAIILGIIAGVTMLLMGEFFSMNIYIIIIPVFVMLFLSGLIFANMMSYCLGLFSHIGGTASAVYGTCFVGGTTLITIFVSDIKVSSQIPMALMYTLMFCLSLFLFVMCHKPRIYKYK